MIFISNLKRIPHWFLLALSGGRFITSLDMVDSVSYFIQLLPLEALALRNYFSSIVKIIPLKLNKKQNSRMKWFNCNTVRLMKWVIHLIIPSCILIALLSSIHPSQVIKHLLSRIYKKYISKKSQYSHPRNSADSSLSPISSLYHQILPKSEKKKMIEFVQMGTILPKEFFHPIVRPCLLSLIPTYRSFLRTTAGEKYRQEVLEADAEFLHCSILLIQNKWRQVLAKLWRQRHTVPGSTEWQLKEMSAV